jgi:hypothetical protein
MKPIRAFALVLAFAAPAAHAAPFTVFTEDFAEERASSSNAAQNFTALDQFSITRGSVDLFGDGGFGLPCPSTGCLDLDGSNAGARLETAPLAFQAGVDYTLSFNIRGNARNRPVDTLSYGIDNGVLATMTLTRASADPYGVVSAPFTVASNTTGRLFFDHAGADSFGILLDRADIVGVRTSVVPVPAALSLLAARWGC